MRVKALLWIVVYVIDELAGWFRFLHQLATLPPELPVIPPHLN